MAFVVFYIDPPPGGGDAAHSENDLTPGDRLREITTLLRKHHNMYSAHNIIVKIA